MQNSKKILAIIPARGGSKGLKNKNIKNLNGKPLISYTINASIKSKYITKTVVSSDKKKILNIAKRYKADILKRPKKYAVDKSSSEVVVRHTLKELKKQKLIFDYIILLQPTSPLRDQNDIDKAFKLFFKTKATSLISVKNIDNKILKAFIETKDGYIKGISNNKYPFMPRQNLPKTYISNGAIYIIKVKKFLKSNSFFTNKTVSYIMNYMKSLDIDTQEDFDNIEKLIEVSK